MIPQRPSLYVALDVDSRDRAIDLARVLCHPKVGFKLGPRLALHDSDLVSRISEFGPLFLDCKFLDIPSTMEASVQTAFELGASSCTIHALAGPEALARLAALERSLQNQATSQRRPIFQIHAVTILTSFTQQSLPPSLKHFEIVKHVEALTSDVVSSGLSSVVCSVEEAVSLRARWPMERLNIVCPGVRSAGGDKGDQARIATPEVARQAGASSIVVGRPIIEARDPRAALEQFLSDFSPSF